MLQITHILNIALHNIEHCNDFVHFLFFCHVVLEVYRYYKLLWYYTMDGTLLVGQNEMLPLVRGISQRNTLVNYGSGNGIRSSLLKVTVLMGIISLSNKNPYLFNSTFSNTILLLVSKTWINMCLYFKLHKKSFLQKSGSLPIKLLREERNDVFLFIFSFFYKERVK